MSHVKLAQAAPIATYGRRGRVETSDDDYKALQSPWKSAAFEASRLRNANDEGAMMSSRRDSCEDPSQGSSVDIGRGQDNELAAAPSRSENDHEKSTAPRFGITAPMNSSASRLGGTSGSSDHLGEDLLARVRSQMDRDDSRTSNTNVSSSLSSAPHLVSSSGSTQSSSEYNSSALIDPEETLNQDFQVSRRCTLAQKMRTKGKGRALKISSPIKDDVHGEVGSEEDISSRGPRPVKRSIYAISDGSQPHSETTTNSEQEEARKERHAATQRKHKLSRMAARKRLDVSPSPTLEDDFFQSKQRQTEDDRSHIDDPIRSSSNADDSDDGLMDPEDLIAAARRDRTIVSKFSLQASEHRHRKGRKELDASKREYRRAKGPKQLSKKKMEEMHKVSAKIARNRPVASLTLQSNPIPRQQYDIRQLAARFNQPLDSPQEYREILSDDLDDMATSDPIEAGTPYDPRTTRARPVHQASPSMQQLTVVTDDQISASTGAKELGRRHDELRLRKEQWLQKRDGKDQPQANSTSDDVSGTEDDIEITGLPSKPMNGIAAGQGVSSLSKQGAAPSLSDKTSSFNPARGGTHLAARQAKADRATMAARKRPFVATELSASLLDIIKLQNIKARSSREITSHGAAEITGSVNSKQSTSKELKRIKDRIQLATHEVTAGSSFDDQIDGQVDEAAKEEYHDDDEADDFVLHNPGDGNYGVSEAHSEDAEQLSPQGSQLVDDSELEEVIPPSSQNTNRSWPALEGLVSAYDFASTDDKQDDVTVLHKSRISKRRGRVVVDDEEGTGREIFESTSGPIDAENAPGLTQFFQPTQQDKVTPSSQSLVLKDPSQVPTIERPLLKPNMEQIASENSILEQFFADTQLSEPPRGHSLDVIGETNRARNAENAVPFLQSSSELDTSAGLSQFFKEGTQTQQAAEVVPANIDSNAMLPPNVPADDFAALRRQAQTNEDLLASLVSLPSPLHSLNDEDEAALQRQLHEGSDCRRTTAEAHKQYLNHEGFFTQTRPAAGSSPSQWTHSQTAGHTVGCGEGESLNLYSALHHGVLAVTEASQRDLPDATRSSNLSGRKRFRRTKAPQLEEDDSFDNVSDLPRSEREDQSSNQLDMNEARSHALAPMTKLREATAWEVLQQGTKQAKWAAACPVVIQRQRRIRDHQFLESEAEESEDEDGNKRRGGLDGVFSDSGGDEDDREDDEDDDEDLEDLVDNERELDEAEKDKLARQRYQQDLEADEAAALALAEKAARGDLRIKRRGRDGEKFLEGILDDDFDEERLMRRANKPWALILKRRKIKNDGMDLLAARVESQAFVQGYAETHDHSIADEYGFLAAADEGSDSEQEGDVANDINGGSPPPEGMDVFGDKQLFASKDVDRKEMLTRQQLAEKVRERRKRRKLGYLPDDDDEDENLGSLRTAAIPEAQRPDDPFASDNSDNESGIGSHLSTFLHDRLLSFSRMTNSANGWSSNFSKSRSADLNGGDADEQLMLADDPATAILSSLDRKRGMSPRSTARFAKLAEEFKSDSVDYTSSRRGGTAGAGVGSSITSFGNTGPKVADGPKASRPFPPGVSSSRNVSMKGRPHTKASSGGAILARRNVEESQ